MKLTAKNSSDTKQQNINGIILSGVFAAVVTVCSWITVPLPFTQVPINLAILGVLLAGGLLGSKYGALSLLVYILLGAVGLPVFAGFGAGLGAIAGPTGGYIVGYLLCAAISGLGTGSKAVTSAKAVTDTGSKAVTSAKAVTGTGSNVGTSTGAGLGAGSVSPSPANPGCGKDGGKGSDFPWKLIFFMAVGVLACYAFGTIWYVILMKTSLWVGLIACVFPFIPFDAVKIAIAAFLTRRLQRVLR